MAYPRFAPPPTSTQFVGDGDRRWRRGGICSARAPGRAHRLRIASARLARELRDRAHRRHKRPLSALVAPLPASAGALAAPPRYSADNGPVKGRGFHHHASLCIAAYAFLAAERLAHFPLSRWPSSAPLVYPQVSRRGALPVRPERHVPESIATMYPSASRAATNSTRRSIRSLRLRMAAPD
jgi:hypothetical protein